MTMLKNCITGVTIHHLLLIAAMDQLSCHQTAPVLGLKRKRINVDALENMGLETAVGHRVIAGSAFITILAGYDFYQTEQWKSEDASLYMPVLEDIMLNVRSFDQVTFRSGSFFVSDLAGTYESTRKGIAIHLWKYDAVSRRLFISKSLLATSTELYDELRRNLLLC